MKAIYGIVAITGLTSLALAATRVPAEELDGREMPRRAPPPGAFEACENKDEGDKCMVQIPDTDEEIEGTCVHGAGRDDSVLVCRPTHLPPRGA